MRERYFALPDGSDFLGHNNLALDGMHLFLTDHDEPAGFRTYFSQLDR